MTLGQAMKQHIEKTFAENRYNVTKTAEKLGIPRATCWRYLVQFELVESKADKLRAKWKQSTWIFNMGDEDKPPPSAA